MKKRSSWKKVERTYKQVFADLEKQPEKGRESKLWLNMTDDEIDAAYARCGRADRLQMKVEAATEQARKNARRVVQQTEVLYCTSCNKEIQTGVAPWQLQIAVEEGRLFFNEESNPMCRVCTVENIDRVMDVFGVPPGVLELVEKQNRRNVEGQS